MSDAELDLADLIRLLGKVAEDDVYAALTRAGLRGLTETHGFLFQQLEDGPSTVGTIAAAIGISQQAVSKHVKELVNLGYIAQGNDDVDRRRRPLELTPLGQQAAKIGRKARAKFVARLEASVGVGEVEVVEKVLRQAAADLGATKLRLVRVTPQRS